MCRAQAERQAVNTVCQGSAADLLKLAITNVSARLQRELKVQHTVCTHLNGADTTAYADFTAICLDLTKLTSAQRCTCNVSAYCFIKT
jgi:DNA polymerase family A